MSKGSPMVSVRLPSMFYDALRKYAAQKGQSLSEALRDIIVIFLDSYI